MEATSWADMLQIDVNRCFNPTGTFHQYIMIESELKQHFEHLFPPNSQLHLTLHQFLTEWAKKKVLTAFPFPRATKHYCGLTFLAAKIIIPPFSMVQHDLIWQYIQLLLLLTLKFTLQNWHKDTWCWLNWSQRGIREKSGLTDLFSVFFALL